jgi:hypothetical protein
MRLHRFKISGKIAVVDQRSFPALPDTGPPSTAGFVFLGASGSPQPAHAGGITNQL